MRRLELPGDRFWEVVRDGATLTITSGKLGTPGRQTTKSATDDAAAEALLESLLVEMQKRGYRPVEELSDDDAPTPADTERRNLDLERAIASDPESRGAYEVYADWLQGHDEPRGELIARQLAAEAGNAKAGRAADELLATRSAYFLGEVARDVCVHVTWRRGFVQAARVDEDGNESLGALLRHPSARFLAELRVEVAHDTHAATLEALCEHVPPALRVLEVLAYDAVDLAAALARCPALQRLSVTAPACELGAVGSLTLPALEQLRIAGHDISGSCLRVIAGAPWPALQRLELHGVVNADARDFVGMLARTDLPALRLLRVRDAPFAGPICVALAESPLAGQLVTIDLASGDIDRAADVRTLAAAASRFTHLREIFLPLTVSQLAGLAGIAKHVLPGERAVVDAELRSMGMALESEYFDEIQE